MSRPRYDDESKWDDTVGEEPGLENVRASLLALPVNDHSYLSVDPRVRPAATRRMHAG